MTITEQTILEYLGSRGAAPLRSINAHLDQLGLDRRAHVNDLVGNGHLAMQLQPKGSLYSLTGHGERALRALRNGDGERARPRTIQMGEGRYEGRELRAYEGRPGAMDAYRLPSLISGRQVWRRGGLGK